MAAIDDLKAQRDDLTNTLDALQAQKASHQARIDFLNARIATVRDRKDRIVLAIRDLSDNWNPA
jgi:uncharacterized coiled-coil DUF342 family protein